MLSRSVSRLSATLVALACAVCAPASAQPLDTLLHAVAERNAIAHAVAASKYPQDRPVEDVPREAQVIAAKRAAAAARGLDPDAVEQLYRQLIAANKLVQHLDYQQFRRGAPVPPAPPLAQLRARIDAVDAQVLDAWPALQQLRQAPACAGTLAAAISRQGQDGIAHAALVRAMVGFCRHDGSAQAHR